MKVEPAEARGMRAVIARGHVRAPAAPAISWSTKPERKKKPSPAEKALADRGEANRIAWAARHPEAAAAERRLRKSRAELLKRWDHKNDGTPETHEHAARTNQGAIARLYESGAINAEQLAAAVEIGEVAERIAGDVAVKTASLETRVDVTRMGDGTFYERLSQVRHEVAYTRWRAQLQAPAPVLDMIVGEPAGFTIVARRYRMHHRRAKRLLIAALDLWPRVLREAVKEIDDATIAAAHAGIL